MSDWDQETLEWARDPPRWYLSWLKAKALASLSFLVLQWVLMLGAQSIKAEAVVLHKPYGVWDKCRIVEKRYRLSLPGWLWR